MDNHLNIFYSYAQGKFNSDIDSENALEDNITRALIITLQRNPDLTKFILEKFFSLTYSPSEINVKYFKYDLQNLDEEELIRIQGYKKKFLFGISSIDNDKIQITKEKLTCYKGNEQIKRIVDWIDKPYTLSNQMIGNHKDNLKIFKSKLKTCIDQIKKIEQLDNNKQVPEIEIESNMSQEKQRKIEDIAIELFKDKRFVPLDNFNWVSLKNMIYLYEVANGSRPDAWIWTENGTNDFVVLVENKINGSLYKEQIVRHIQREKGFHCNIDAVELKILTWKEIYKNLKDYQDIQNFNNPIGKFLLTSFLKYLEVNNMGDFIGFDQDDFLLNDRSQTWKRMKKMLDYILHEKFKEDFNKYFISQENSELYKFQKSVGGLKVYLGRENIQNFAHYTFYLGKEGFFINISFPSNKGPHKNLVDRISTNIEQFKKLIASQEYSYDFKVHLKYGKLNRTGKYAPNNDQIFPLYCSYLTKFLEKDYYTFDSKGYDFKTMKIELKHNQDFYDYWTGNIFEEVKKINNPFIVIEKRFSIPYILNTGKDFKEICFKVVKDLLPIYEFANKLE